MRILLRQFGAIARMTAARALRQPVLLLIAVSGGVVALLLPVLIAHQFGEEGKLVRDSALALYFVLGLPFAVFAADLLRGEHADGNAAITLSKAVRPEVFFLARFAGISMLTAGYAASMTAAVLLADRIAPRLYLADTRFYTVLAILAPAAAVAAALWNLFTRRSFCAAAWMTWLAALGAALLIAARIDAASEPGDALTRALQWRIVPAAILIAAALTVFTAIAAVLGARLRAAPAVALAFLILLAGLLAEYFPGRFARQSRLAAAAYCVVPNWQHFWCADLLTGGGTVPAAHFRNALVYAALYTSGVLALGAAVWRHTEAR